MFDHPPPRFRALDPNKQVTVRRRHLPHWRQDGATYFVTFRLADSLPQSKLDQLQDEREIWQRAHPDPTHEQIEEQLRQHMQHIERWLDQGSGSCGLREKAQSDIVEGRMRYMDGEQYELFSFAIMPNHCHACLRPKAQFELDDILAAWKSISAKAINKQLGRSGPLWQEESYDRIVRDSEHLRRVVNYIEANPAKAGISAPCWTTPDWDAWLGR